MEATITVENKKKNGFFAKLAKLIKVVQLIVELLVLSIYAAYIIYEIVRGSFVALKVVLLVATVAYAIFFIIQHNSADKTSKKRKKIGKKVYSLIKLLVKGGTLALTIYGFTVAQSTATFWSVALAVMMAIGWCASVFFEIVGFALSILLKKVKIEAGKTFAGTKEKVTASAKETTERVTHIAKNTATMVKSLFTRTGEEADGLPNNEAAELPEGEEEE